MKLIRNLKKKVEKAQTKAEAREVIKRAGMLLEDDELECVNGGNDNLKAFEKRYCPIHETIHEVKCLLTQIPGPNRNEYITVTKCTCIMQGSHNYFIWDHDGNVKYIKDDLSLFMNK